MSKKINILHMRYGFKLGGVENFIVNLIKNSFEDPKLKHNLLVFNDNYDGFLIEELKKYNCNSFFIKNNETRNPLTLFKIINIIKNNNINILSCHDPGAVKWAFLCKIFFPGIKIIFRVNDTNIANQFNKLEFFITKNFVDKIIANSNATLKEIKEINLNAEVIYNGVDLKSFQTDKQVNYYSDTLKIVNLAWIRLPKKGQDLLIKALGICKQKGIKFSCDLIGGIYDKESYNLLLNLIKENNIENEVKFLGVKTNIPDILKDYNLFVFPSRFEGFGFVILEAMAAGLPVIANNVDAPGELINHNENGILFENENYYDLADKICKLYNDRSVIEKIVSNGFNFVQGFDIHKMCAKYINVYQKILEDKNV